MGGTAASRALDELLDQLEGAGFDGAIIHKRENIRYLSAFTGEGMLAVTRGLRAIVTDFRYVEQAGIQAPGWRTISTTSERGHGATAYTLLRGSVKRLAFEDDYVSVAHMRKLGQEIPDVEFGPIDRGPEKLREIKTPEEIASIAKACEIACAALESILDEIRPGRTEREIAWTLERAMLERGAEKPAFETIAASGPNGSLPHAVPSDRKLEKGDFLTLDFGARHNGYCSDITRTLAIGGVSPDKRKVYETVLTAQTTALDAVKPGRLCREIDSIARDYIDAAGYGGMFGHGLGHSLGLLIHEDPRFSQSAGGATVKVGHVMTVEPGIYRPGLDGVRIEDTVKVTEDGAVRLTTMSKELITL
ncbi:MAG: aminopeptidase P family protein [Oscillospiraceae bacterium]|jgi:Xaa-Pro aminopeptidase|nr:aminopeptidase P family protein [Oscillospiraceae bacterium]